MPSGGEIELASHLLADDGKIEITISDTGPGIPADKLNHIFEPFFTTKENGMGLGLAITYKIIKEHGGEIVVRSGEGKGTTFSLTLPVI